ncbi:MAG: hypothetical protein JO261_13875 [Alphaproteobacteria bacterium]|nr:hypothetical protein [Alphaproteobacteria bacterium]MBV9694781.1 hypothetical protein [Alphaproteobacteria bacterium]
MGELAVTASIFLGFLILACVAVWLMYGKRAGILRALAAIAIMVVVICAWGWLALGGGCEIDWLLFKDSSCM